jgi:uncharacterized Fe-S cluster protein YjdI/CDGSH-type Zn-finger protein
MSTTPPADEDRTIRAAAKRYTGADIAVSYEAGICLHQAECLRGLPAVFDVERRPWIDVNSAPAAATAEVVTRCPSGALQYHMRGGPQEEAQRPTDVQRRSDGVVYIRGDLDIRTAQGMRHETRVMLCGCGQSKKEPFCDHSGPCGREV